MLRSRPWRDSETFGREQGHMTVGLTVSNRPLYVGTARMSVTQKRSKTTLSTVRR